MIRNTAADGDRIQVILNFDVEVRRRLAQAR
jgi:hypothetical protein